MPLNYHKLALWVEDTVPVSPH